MKYPSMLNVTNYRGLAREIIVTIVTDTRFYNMMKNMLYIAESYIIRYLL